MVESASAPAPTPAPITSCLRDGPLGTVVLELTSVCGSRPRIGCSGTRPPHHSWVRGHSVRRPVTHFAGGWSTHTQQRSDFCAAKHNLPRDESADRRGVCRPCFAPKTPCEQPIFTHRAILRVAAISRSRMLSDLEIAHAQQMRPVREIAHELGVPEEYYEPYGRYKAKLSLASSARSPTGRPGATSTSPRSTRRRWARARPSPPSASDRHLRLVGAGAVPPVSGSPRSDRCSASRAARPEAATRRCCPWRT